MVAGILMAGLFYSLGKLVGPKVRKGKWVWNSLTADEDQIIQAEYETGRDMATAMLEEMPPEGGGAEQLVVDVGSRLAGRLTNSKRRWEFHLVGSEAPNAFALPGGFIFITRSLVELCERKPDEIAFILGHEIGHVIRGHSFDRLVSSTLMTAASRATPLGRAVGPGMMGMGLKLMQSAYTRDQELEADAFGARLAHSGGFDRTACLRMMQRLHERHTNDPASEVFAWFATHPPFPARMAAVRKVIAA